jgi:thioredoxin 2
VQAAAQLEPDVRLAKVNTDEMQRVASEHRIASIPTLVLFKNGKEVARQAGAMPLPHLLHWIRTHVSS